MKHILSKGLCAVFLIFIVAISIAPLIWGLISSFKTNGEIIDSAFSLPARLNTANYINAFRSTPLTQYLVNSAVITLLTIAAGLLLFSMAAYVFARVRFFGRGALYAAIAMSMFIPPAAIVYPIYMLVNRIGLYNTKAILVIAYLALSMPSCIYVLRSYYLSIPRGIDESAYIDGAGFFRTFFAIMLPLAGPGLATSAILIYLTSWNDFLYALILTSGNKARTVSVALSQFLSSFGSDYGQLFAASVIVVMPSIILYLILQNRVESALIAGSVKG